MMYLRLLSTGIPVAGAALLLAACVAGLGGDIPQVDGPAPVLEPASDDIEAFAVVRLPPEWTLYSSPPELFGVPVLQQAADGTEWDLTGRWTVDRDRAMRMKGNQVWVLMGGIYTWYRLTGAVEPWGRMHLWAQLPDDWIYGGPATVPEVNPVPGIPWSTVPYSLGHVAEPARGGMLELRVCPDTACPVLGRPEDGQQVPVTGRLTAASGREWYRVEYRQQILWAPVDAGRIRISLAGRLRRYGAQAAGYRSCEPVVMFPPPPHTLCPVGADGRFLDLFEREYDWLDPVFGRLPTSKTIAPDAPPQRPAPQGQVPAVPGPVESEPVTAIPDEAPSGVVYHAPGTYPDATGLDYDWDLVFEDQSAWWDWTIPDPDSCYDALRAHLGKRPRWYGLRQTTVILKDPASDFDWSRMPQGSVHFPRAVAWESGLPEDGAMVHVGCRNANFMTPRHDAGEFVCEVHPLWGHAGTSEAANRLNGALAQALATYLGYAVYQEEAIKARHWEMEDTWAQPPYLYPRDTATGEPAGEGPCLRLIEVAGE